MAYYAGSTMFLWLSDWTRLPIDQCNFLITQFLCLGAAFAYRRFLHPTKVSPETRLVVALFLGLFFTYFCFGIDILHLIGLPLCCFLAIQFLPVGISHCVCLAMSLVYLSAVHLWRQWTDYGAYVIDITGPLMIITQKVTSLAFSLHDGLGKSWDVLTPSQKRYAIRRKPGVLEYFGYVLNFQGVCAGPMVFYVDYEEFIRGTNFQHTANARGLSIPPKKTPLKLENGVSSEASRCSSSVELTSGPVAATSPPCDSPLDFDDESSPVVEVTAKVSHSLLFALGFLIFAPLFDIRRLKDDDFLNSSFIYRAFYIVAATSVARWKYYLAWILADAIANASGLGFGGYDAYGSPHWDLLSNVDVRGVEIGPSFRDLIDSWNKGTSRWLRMTIYERVPKLRTLSAYLVSAFWHGFYPGYYLTFIGGALFTLASRAARRSIRPLFLKSPRTKFIYDCITTVAARFMLAYITYPFVLLDWKPSIEVYKSFYFIPHIIGLLYIIALPIILPGPKRERVPVPKKTEVNQEEKLKSC